MISLLKKNKTILSLLCLLLLASACDGTKDGNKETPPEDPGQVREISRGPITVRTRTDRKELTIAQQLRFEIEVDVQEDYEVTLPKVGEKLQQFGIVDYGTSQPKLIADKQLRITRFYLLEPFLSGEYKIPPMKIQFRKKENPEDPQHEVETEELVVKIRSLLPENVEKLEIADIAPQAEFPPPSRAWMWWTAGGTLFVLAGAAAVLVLLRRRKRAEAPEIRIPAHEIAYRELRELVEKDFVSQGMLKEFYQEISGILRHYIENRFGLHAPEQTTEEFLIDLSKAKSFAEKHKLLLQDFLTHCDLVKFAAHAPDEAEIQKTFDSTKAFIEETREAGQ